MPETETDAGQPSGTHAVGDGGIQTSSLEDRTMDIFAVALILVFFAVAAAFVRGCHKLEEE